MPAVLIKGPNPGGYLEFTSQDKPIFEACNSPALLSESTILL